MGPPAGGLEGHPPRACARGVVRNPPGLGVLGAVEEEEEEEEVLDRSPTTPSRARQVLSLEDCRHVKIGK